jgi:DNA-binding transcriptional LysR family regulator
MELRHIRYFIAVAKEENVSRAAQKLHLSQPALSRQIQDLEEELGFLLLERTAKSVRLTEAGKVFFSEGQEVLARVEQAIKAARAVVSDGAGELHVGYAPSPTVRLLPASLRLFQTRFPRMRVRLHDMTTEEMIAGVRQGELSMAIAVRPTTAMLRGLRFEELIRDTLCLAVHPKHTLARFSSVSLERAVKEPFVAYNDEDYPEYSDFLIQLFESTGREPKIVETQDSGASMVAAIEAGTGVAVMPQSFACVAGPRLTLVPLTPTPPPLSVGGLWLADKLSGPARNFLECAREASRKLT